jgi:dihydroorotase
VHNTFVAADARLTREGGKPLDAVAQEATLGVVLPQGFANPAVQLGGSDARAKAFHHHLVHFDHNFGRSAALVNFLGVQHRDGSHGTAIVLIRVASTDMSRLLIRGGHCVRPDGVTQQNILIENGAFLDFDPPASAHTDDVIDATGMHVFPGLIDDQVHFREPGLTHKEDLRTGSMAAAKGGVTAFMEMPNTSPTTTSADALSAKLARAKRSCVVDYGFFGGATGQNTAWLREETRACGIKIFIGSSTGDLLVDEQELLEEIFAQTRLPIAAHCEDETLVRANAAALDGGLVISDHSKIRNAEAAAKSAARTIDLARRHKHRFHLLHVSSAAECDVLRDRPEWVTAEACPHHLFFDTTDYDRLGSRVQMNPALKSPEDKEAVWAALQDGTIEVLATDHAPHTLEEKDEPYPRSPSGLPSIEWLLPLMINAASEGRCTFEQIAAWGAANPAKIWDLKGKGSLKVGLDADFSIVDTEALSEVQDGSQVTKCNWSPWHGSALRGMVCSTWVRGFRAYHEGQFADPGSAQPLQYERGVS